MTTPTNDDGAESRVNLGKGPDSGTESGAGAGGEPDFDPYRYGRPDHPIPAEYAPPGYVPDAPAVPPPPGTYPQVPYGQNPYGQTPYGQAPYGQAPYGQNPYGHPYPPGRPVSTGTNGKAVTSLVLGIASIVLCWLSFLALVVIVPAVVFGIIALNESKHRNGNGRSMAVAGIATAVVGALLATLLTVVIFRAADKCGGLENSGDVGFQECVQDNL